MKSLFNHFMANSAQPVPQVGMGVTVCMYSDRYAGTITEVSASGKRFKFRRDKAKRTDKNGMSEAQSYLYQIDPEGAEYTAFLNKSGQWRIMKQGTPVALGYRKAYHDYSH